MLHKYSIDLLGCPLVTHPARTLSKCDKSGGFRWTYVRLAFQFFEGPMLVLPAWSGLMFLFTS